MRLQRSLILVLPMVPPPTSAVSPTVCAQQQVPSKPSIILLAGSCAGSLD